MLVGMRVGLRLDLLAALLLVFKQVTSNEPASITFRHFQMCSPVKLYLFLEASRSNPNIQLNINFP